MHGQNKTGHRLSVTSLMAQQCVDPAQRCWETGGVRRAQGPKGLMESAAQVSLASIHFPQQSPQPGPLRPFGWR